MEHQAPEFPLTLPQISQELNGKKPRNPYVSPPTSSPMKEK